MAQILPFDGETRERAPAEDAFRVDVDGFEGPLDLLLELARRQKVDLNRISVLALAERMAAALPADAYDELLTEDGERAASSA